MNKHERKQALLDQADTLFRAGRDIPFVKKVTSLTIAEMVREGLITESTLPGVGKIRVPVGQKFGGGK